jgi:hypothetical protein
MKSYLLKFSNPEVAINVATYLYQLVFILIMLLKLFEAGPALMESVAIRCMYVVDDEVLIISGLS